MADDFHHYMAFGLRLVSDAPLPGFLAAESGATDLQVFFHAKLPDVAQLSAFRREVPEVPGLVYETVAGSNVTEIRVLHESGTIRLLLEGSRASFAWSSGIDIRTVKALFSGMILKSIALWRGKFALHAGAVEIPGTGTLVIGGPDSSTLAAIYLLGERLPAGEAVACERLDKPRAVALIARELSEAPEVVLPRGDKMAALQNVLPLVRDVPVYRLRLPNDLSRVQDVARRLMHGTLVAR